MIALNASTGSVVQTVPAVRDGDHAQRQEEVQDANHSW